MGRVRRAIVSLQNKRSRLTTYRKRSAGAMKKLHELSVLCNQDIFLYIRDQETGKLQTFASCDEKFVPDYDLISQEDRKGPKDMQIYYTQAQNQKQNQKQKRDQQKTQSNQQPSDKSENQWNIQWSNQPVNQPHNQNHGPKWLSSSAGSEEHKSAHSVTTPQAPPRLDCRGQRNQGSSVWNIVSNPRIIQPFSSLMSQSESCQRTFKATLRIFTAI
ncbi:hypothetical protein N7522_006420 [Penicillium canescens]|nr:hypothetical protein N7522_006420 [Penicillium canescens]